MGSHLVFTFQNPQLHAGTEREGSETLGDIQEARKSYPDRFRGWNKVSYIAISQPNPMVLVGAPWKLEASLRQQWEILYDTTTRIRQTI
jgi:hypothetical protein